MSSIKWKASQIFLNSVQALGAIGLCLTLAGCSTGQKKPAGSNVATDSEKLEVIDAHIHTRLNGKPERSSGIIITKDTLLKEFAEAGVVGAISHTSEDGDGYVEELKQSGVQFCAGAAQHPDLKRIEAGLKSGKYSCIKIYLGYVHQWAYDPHYRPLYKLAEKYDVPVVFQTGDTYSTKGKLKFADPLTIDEVAVDFPKVNFVIAHCGNPWIQSAAEVAYKNPNVYLDGSALLIGNLYQQPKEKIDAYVTQPLTWIFGYLEDPSKLMFGTDWPLTNIGSYVDAFKKAIPKEHWKAVFHDNAYRVFHFDRVKKKSS